jgi:hypothetical protein
MPVAVLAAKPRDGNDESRKPFSCESGETVMSISGRPGPTPEPFPDPDPDPMPQPAPPPNPIPVPPVR